MLLCFGEINMYRPIYNEHKHDNEWQRQTKHAYRYVLRTEIIIIVIILFCPKNIKYAARV